jgi:hypothetical protein
MQTRVSKVFLGEWLCIFLSIPEVLSPYRGLFQYSGFPVSQYSRAGISRTVTIGSQMGTPMYNCGHWFVTSRMGT